MKNYLVFFVLTLLTVRPLAAQSQVPALDIAILTDISASMGNKDEDTRRKLEAQRMIAQLVTGHALDPQEFPWDADTTEVLDPTARELFGAYSGDPTGKVPPARLTAPGNHLLIMRIGKFLTVDSRSRWVQRQVRENYGFAALVMSSDYPGPEEREQSTCYWYALANAATQMRGLAPGGYYLFVLSDQEDDPDYLKDAHDRVHKTEHDRDYEEFQKHFKAGYPEKAIESTILTFFDRNRGGYDPRRPGGDFYKPRPDFPMTLIARFYPRGLKQRIGPGAVSLSWYLVGTPFPPTTPRVVPSAPLAVVPAPTPKPVEAPSFKPSIQLLGGLRKGTAKRFSYAHPVIAWQLPFGEATGLDSDDFKVIELKNDTDENAVLQTVGHLTPESVAGVPGGAPVKASREMFHGPSRAWLSFPQPRDKHYIQVRSNATGADGGPSYRSEIVCIEIAPHDESWLLKLSIGSFALALTVFVWTLVKLRPMQGQPVPR